VGMFPNSGSTMIISPLEIMVQSFPNTNQKSCAHDSIANLDLAAGFDEVLVLQPDLPPFPYLENLDEQRERLQYEGA
jgi:hypothetical protein